MAREQRELGLAMKKRQSLRNSLFALLVLYGQQSVAEYPKFADNPHLTAGRSVWLDSCEGCHGYGIAGAPMPTDAEAWKPRLEKPLNLLYQHALEGFFGPADTMMPARGGNDALSDEEVKSAVDYMLEFARLHGLPKTK